MKVGDLIYRDPNAKQFSREPVTDDTHLARIYAVIDLGLITDPKFHKTHRKIMVLFEIVDDIIKDGDYKGKPKVMNAAYNLGSHEKSSFRKDLLKAVEGRMLSEQETKNYDTRDLLGKPLKIDVIHQKNEKDPTVIYPNISGLSRIGKSEVVPELVHEPFILNLEDFDKEAFKKIPKWIREKKMNLDGVPGIDKILAEIEAENQAKDDDRSDAIKRAQNV